jgi:hypothetical protein
MSMTMEGLEVILKQNNQGEHSTHTLVFAIKER